MNTPDHRIMRYTKEKYLTAFILGTFIILCTFIPMMICENGYFIYYGDYNAQQIPFYNLANDAVRNRQFGWNWYTDLGSDLLTSYSFYLIGSPFFWLSTLLPRSLVTYSMPFLLSIKHGFAAVTSYAYIRRFVRGKNSALIGALLYTFSGFQVFNLFFNHFQDVTAFFPLMLIAMEENINQRRKGIFAVTVGLMAVINYYFFAGQAVFLVIYYLFRMRCSDFHTSWKKFFLLCFEAVIGGALAAFILLPSAMLILGNYRVSQHLYGIDMLLYTDHTTIPRIIQTFFMPVDTPARPNLFKSDYGKWASIGGYLPLFSMVGVLTFMKSHKKHWASALSVFCIIASFIPVINSAFQAMNGYYYARWFYMPILIFSMMTARTIDEEGADIMPAVKINAIMLGAFTLISFIPKKNSDDKLEWFKFPSDPVYFYITLAVAVISLLLTVWLFRIKRKGGNFFTISLWTTAAACVVCIYTASLYGAVTPEDAKDYVAKTIDSSDDVWENVSEDNFFRIDTSENCDNYPMIWKIPTMRAFQSVVEPSIMEFYDKVGVKRDVASRADITHYTLRGLFSVKYYYREKTEGMKYPSGVSTEYSSESSAGSSSASNEIKAKDRNITEELPGFEYIGENKHYEVYRNTLYLPMGIPYDYYMSDEETEKKSKQVRERMLINALILTDEQAEKYGDIIAELPSDMRSGISQKFYCEACSEKAGLCGTSFSYDSKGFRSVITLSEDKLVMYSVPYSKGWTAEVNGKAADVEKVSFGLMAVKAEAGDNTIVFRYRTPYLREGIIISLGALLILLGYLIISRIKRREPDIYDISHSYDYDSVCGVAPSRLYCGSFRKDNSTNGGKNNAS